MWAEIKIKIGSFLFVFCLRQRQGRRCIPPPGFSLLLPSDGASDRPHGRSLPLIAAYNWICFFICPFNSIMHLGPLERTLSWSGAWLVSVLDELFLFIKRVRVLSLLTDVQSWYKSILMMLWLTSAPRACCTQMMSTLAVSVILRGTQTEVSLCVWSLIVSESSFWPFTVHAVTLQLQELTFHPGSDCRKQVSFYVFKREAINYWLISSANLTCLCC